jgi:biopolymer transport protein ExbD
MEFHRPTRKPLTVPIIALIDIFAVLLIFFIVSMTPKKPRPILRINLPTVTELPTDTVVEERAVLAVAPGGRVTLEQLEVPEGLLVEFLKVFQTENPGRQMELKIDEAVSVKRLLEVWAALTQAGIEIKDVPARIRVPITPE